MERIGPYVVRRFLVETVFARLYLAVDEALQRYVVIKVFAVDPLTPEPPLSRHGWLDRFLAEGRVMARLDHPYILGIHDTAALEDGTPYHVLPFMPCNLPRLIGFDADEAQAETMTDEERPKRLAQAIAIPLLRQVLLALAYLHSKGVIHRDVKPGNLLLTARENGSIKLCDFGMAKIGNRPDLAPGSWIGTRAYMSPEQSTGVTALTDRADVFSAGVLAYRMLSGQLPAPSPIPLIQRVEGLASGLSDLIMSALRPDPKDRPSAEVMARALS